MTRKFAALAGALMILFAAPVPSQAMKVTPMPLTQDGFLPINAVGEIVPGDGEKFAAILSTHDKGVVYFSSRGGNAWAGMQIGAHINNHPGFITMVSRGSECYSACALAWLGGRNRVIDYGAVVGFHGAYTKDGSNPSAINALVGNYLGELGLSIDAIVFVTAKSPDDADYLTPSKRINIL